MLSVNVFHSHSGDRNQPGSLMFSCGIVWLMVPFRHLNFLTLGISNAKTYLKKFLYFFKIACYLLRKVFSCSLLNILKVAILRPGMDGVVNWISELVGLKEIR